MTERRVFEGEVVICWDSLGEPVVLRSEGRSDLTMEALENKIANNYLGKRVRVTIEQADATDAVLTWLEHEASDARRVLVAERDPGNIEIMRQWVYHHECMVRKRLDELGLLDVDDEPAGTRSADEIRAKLSRIQSLEYRPARPLTFAWGAIWALRWALGEATADRQWIIYCECEDGDRYEDDGLGGERR